MWDSWMGRTKFPNQGIFDRKLQAVRRMIQLQNHRGPDANGIFEDRKCNVIFGHNRLSILELSDAGAQPMVDQSKLGYLI